MKILHTSDWHLGKKLHQFDLLEDQRYFLQWLTDYINEQQINLLLIAGDIFDTAHPPMGAQELYNNFLAQLFKANYPEKIIITDGNHDGRANMRVPKSILKALNIDVACQLEEELDDHIITFQSGDETVLVGAIPFLRDQDLRKSVSDPTIEPEVAIRSGIETIYANLAEKMTAQLAEAPKIAMGHLYTQGVKLEIPETEEGDQKVPDSERPIQMGHQASVNSSIFPATFDYVALGHIHLPQQISGPTEIHYSGAPYPLSFAERNYKSQCNLITIKGQKIQAIDKIRIPVYRKFITLKGTLAEIKLKADQLETFTAPSLIEVKLVEKEYDPLLRSRFDEWREEFHQSQKHAIIVKSSIVFTHDSRDAQQLFQKHQINQQEFTAEKVFQARLELAVDLDELTKKDVLEAFFTLAENTTKND